MTDRRVRRCSASRSAARRRPVAMATARSRLATLLQLAWRQQRVGVGVLGIGAEIGRDRRQIAEWARRSVCATTTAMIRPTSVAAIATASTPALRCRSSATINTSTTAGTRGTARTRVRIDDRRSIRPQRTALTHSCAPPAAPVASGLMPASTPRGRRRGRDQGSRRGGRRRSRRVAHLRRARSPRAGAGGRDRAGRTPHGGAVALLAENSSAYVELLYAAPAAGRRLLLLNYRHHPREWAEMLERAEVQMVLGDAALLALRDTLAGVGSDPGVELITTGSDAYAGDGRGDGTPGGPLAHDPDDVAWLVPTSGTTGTPKLASSPTARCSPPHAAGAIARPIAADDVFLLCVPVVPHRRVQRDRAASARVAARAVVAFRAGRRGRAHPPRTCRRRAACPR